MRFLVPALPTVPPGEDKPPWGQALPPSLRVPAGRREGLGCPGALSGLHRSWELRRLMQLPVCGTRPVAFVPKGCKGRAYPCRTGGRQLVRMLIVPTAFSDSGKNDHCHAYLPLAGYRPIPTDSYLGGNSPLPPPVSDRMRKRRAFADKELENIMLEREYKERDMMEATQAAALFLPNRMVRGAEYNSYKTAFNTTQVDNPNKEFSNFLPTCLDLTMQYSGPSNMELISSNVSVATTYRQYPLPSRFLVWPKCGPISDALLYQQCLLNATAVQALKPGTGWDAKVSQSQDCPNTEHDIMPPKVENSFVLTHARDIQQSRNEILCLHQEARERSAFSPPKRTFSQISDKGSLSPQEQALSKISKNSTKPSPPLKYSAFQSLFHQTFPDTPTAELRMSFVKETFEDASKKYRECAVKENQKYKFTVDKCAKDFFGAKQATTKLPTPEPLSFSVESILKRPSSAVTNVFE
ncbi:doublesex- and mab-3-related transcription factor 2 [Cyanistes caeruleus]|uniref:doublesex- and mab-3-related transcription factor 2 n=1 Tax=Cyanistes caeruleus TaxID=156563 RepID=UPI000CDB8404|nr:doublesex- and mab-3-related transcription factor 2 [Cyanistes caeruleus]